MYHKVADLFATFFFLNNIFILSLIKGNLTKLNTAAFDSLIKNIFKEQNIEDNVKQDLLLQYNECEPIFNSLKQDIYSFKIDKINQLKSNIHSLKGFIRNIGLLKLGNKYHQLENILTYLSSYVGTSEYQQMYDLCAPFISKLFSEITFQHIHYSRGLSMISETSYASNDDKNLEKITNIINCGIQQNTLNENNKVIIKDIHTQLSKIEKGINSGGIQTMILELPYLIAQMKIKINQMSNIVEQKAKLDNKMVEPLLEEKKVMVSNYINRFYETVHSANQHCHKKSQLNILGTNNEIDKTTMDKISFAIEHILRNSVVHGIEMPEKRKKLTKPDVGNITLEIIDSGSTLVITIEDDGCGIDIEKLKSKLHQKDLSRQEILNSIFDIGVSTKNSVDEVSGRGVGLYSVKQTVSELGGHISVDSNKNGTKFTIVIPVNMQLMDLFYLPSYQVNIPKQFVEFIVPINLDFYKKYIENKEFITIDEINEIYLCDKLTNERKIQLFSLNQLLNNTSIAKKIYLMMLKYHHSYMALVVFENEFDNFKSEISPIGKLQQTKGVLGATFNGKIVINPILFIDNTDKEITASDDSHVYGLIIDDSKTACLIGQQTLNKFDIQSVTRENGKDALDYLMQNQDNLPSFILTDYEMPIMNGYELIKKVKTCEALKHIPIVMITSKSLEQYRKECCDIGAYCVLAKPYNEIELKKIVSNFI